MYVFTISRLIPQLKLHLQNLRKVETLRTQKHALSYKK